jgi:hypothetical protein
MKELREETLKTQRLLQKTQDKYEESKTISKGTIQQGNLCKTPSSVEFSKDKGTDNLCSGFAKNTDYKKLQEEKFALVNQLAVSEEKLRSAEATIETLRQLQSYQKRSYSTDIEDEPILTRWDTQQPTPLLSSPLHNNRFNQSTPSNVKEFFCVFVLSLFFFLQQMDHYVQEHEKKDVEISLLPKRTTRGSRMEASLPVAYIALVSRIRC